jgi:hypothetical protein
MVYLKFDVMENGIVLGDALRDAVRKYFVLLEDENIGKQHSALPLRVSGYADVMHLIADLVKVAILALNNDGNPTTAHIPEPKMNIGGMLAVILDLLPYEEAELLDLIRQEVLARQPVMSEEEAFVLDGFVVTPGWFVLEV